MLHCFIILFPRLYHFQVYVKGFLFKLVSSYVFFIFPTKLDIFCGRHNCVTLYLKIFNVVYGSSCDFCILMTKPSSMIICMEWQTLFVHSMSSSWKVAKIYLIFKAGNSDLPENYRPISVLPILSKLTEKAAHQQLLEF